MSVNEPNERATGLDPYPVVILVVDAKKHLLHRQYLNEQ